MIEDSGLSAEKTEKNIRLFRLKRLLVAWDYQQFPALFSILTRISLRGPGIDDVSQLQFGLVNRHKKSEKAKHGGKHEDC